MFNRRWWAFLGLLFAIGLALRNNLFFLFVILLALASGASALWSRYCLHAVTYRRKFADNRIFHGEETDLTIEVTNAKPLPLAWLLIRDAFPRDISLLTGELDAPPERAEQDQEQPQEKSVPRIKAMLMAMMNTTSMPPIARAFSRA